MCVVAAPHLERIDLKLRGELVEQALHPERALDEPGRAERLHRRGVQLCAVLDRVHVVARIEHLHRAGGGREPTVPAERSDELAFERRQRAVGARSGTQLLDRRIAVAGVEILLAASERTLDGTACALRKLGRHVRVVACAVLRSEAAAHVVAHDSHLVLREVELLRDLVADAPDELRRDVDDELVSVPVADRLVRLEGVVQDALRTVRRLDDNVSLREAALDVPTVVQARLGEQRFFAHRLLGIEHRLELLELDVDQSERRTRLCERVRGNRRDRLALVVRLADELRNRFRLENGTDACRLARTRRIEPLHARPRVWRTQHGSVEHARQLNVGRVERPPGGALEAVLPRRRPADDVARSVGPLVERILLDDEPDFLEAAFDFLFGSDQSCHVRIASSIFG